MYKRSIKYEITQIDCLLVSSNKMLNYSLADYQNVMFIWLVFHLQILVIDNWHWDRCSTVNLKYDFIFSNKIFNIDIHKFFRVLVQMKAA